MDLGHAGARVVVNVLVNNAGWSEPGWFAEQTGRAPSTPRSARDPSGHRRHHEGRD